jgi:hypothetical protein
VLIGPRSITISPEVRALAYTWIDLLLDNYAKASEADCRKSDVKTAVSILEESLNKSSSPMSGSRLLAAGYRAIPFPREWQA